MNNKHFYLSYKNDKGEIRSEFNETIESIMKVENSTYMIFLII